MLKEYLRLWRFIKPHMWVLGLAMFFMFLCSIVGGAPLGMIIPLVDKILAGKRIILSSSLEAPDFLLRLVDRINTMDQLFLLDVLIAMSVILFLLRLVFDYCKAYFMNQLGYRFLKTMRDAVYERILGLSMDFFYKNPTGRLSSKIIFDTSVIKDSLIEGLTDLLYQPIQLVVYLCIIIFIKFYFGIPIGLILFSVGVMLLIVYPVIRIGKRIRKISLQSQQKVADINMTVYEALSGISIVKAFSMQDYELQRLRQQNNQYYKISMKSVARMLFVSPITEFIGFICIITVTWIGVRQVISEDLSRGAFLAFVGALISLIKPFKRLSRIHAINQQALAASSRVFSILDAGPSVSEKKDAIKLPRFSKGIIYKNISFGYNGELILKNISLHIKMGEVIAFVGPSGVGKTTLVNLLMRFYNPTDGAIEIDGVDIRDVTLKSLRDQIGLVTQDTYLFNDTVASNIAYGVDISKNMDRIISAAKAANAHEFIMKMPEGYKTIIGERGFRLSGGEKQRLAIARAIFKNPPILILDEATSQLDTKAELLVQEAIDRLMKDRTVLAIAHRLSTIQHANRIYVMDKGQIIESGTHNELMAKGGLYRKLFELQFVPSSSESRNEYNVTTK